MCRNVILKLKLPNTVAEVLALPNVPYRDRDQLPSYPGVYFVSNERGKLLYIGRSVDINFRWQNHHKLAGIDFDGFKTRLHWLLVPCVDELPMVEVKLIHQFEPPLNFQHSTPKSNVANYVDSGYLSEDELLSNPKVQEWIQAEEKPLPRVLKEFTYRRNSGCCSFCGDPYPSKEFFTSASFNEEEVGQKDVCNRFLICRICRPLLRKRSGFLTINELKAEAMKASVERVERAYAILGRFGHRSPELEAFLASYETIRLKFDLEAKGRG